jgi:hypothetical protein
VAVARVDDVTDSELIDTPVSSPASSCKLRLVGAVFVDGGGEADVPRRT